jgi:hypothetical protein
LKPEVEAPNLAAAVLLAAESSLARRASRPDLSITLLTHLMLKGSNYTRLSATRIAGQNT